MRFNLRDYSMPCLLSGSVCGGREKAYQDASNGLHPLAVKTPNMYNV